MIEIVATLDGSVTLYNNEVNQHYHSINGAVSESMLVFIEYGFDFCAKNSKAINILEIGYGTGLNILLTLNRIRHSSDITVKYDAVEAFPMQNSIISSVLSSAKISQADIETFCRIGQAKPYELDKNFTLTKIHETVQDVTLPDNFYNLLYFDAFDYMAQPEMWSEQVLTKLYKAMDKGGVLVTYSCKGVVKQNLKLSGFVIEKLPGPAGKREVLRAIKP
ncbi:MAG: tRNA (5-methylaminomethyl-2-thiouridine)(34)-methyltransferase MnmD [Bacteroidales bacterium]